MTHATAANNTFNIVSLTANEDSESEIKYFESHELTKAVEYEDCDDYILVRANEHFNVSSFSENDVVPIFKKVTPFRALLNSKYRPNPITLRRMIKLLMNNEITAGICLQGESGSGKTELALYISHMLNWPITIKQINNELSIDDLEGMRTLENGNTRYVYSDLVQGYRDGHIILLDEIDKINPDTAAKLHMPLERKPWATAKEGGDLIHANRFTRFIGTANTNMSGDDMRFASSQSQDSAFIKRFLILPMFRPDEKDMYNAAEAHFPELSPSCLRVFAKVAFELNNLKDDELVMGIRELISWIATSKVLDEEISVGFTIAFTSKLSSEARSRADILLEQLFPEEMFLSISQLK
ncbi:AAA family ATPase [Pseudocitrobacter sp. 2023EL-00150]|uniref:ATP-binding protein n=1 Tax=Pseudocitrobacter sp. 2023EL-00150 TaxID=3032322 RepID=UPI0023E3B0BD|nr:AAA family ATPase [Pseudocitrobacter sp. 2023EL-00150]MDF3828702.1 AAA family ATPase [Pseudocitrobacter sp. 2023EL-00150]